MEILGIVDVPLTALFSVVIVFLVYRLGNWRLSLLKEYGIRGPKPMMLFGNTGVVARESLLTAIDKWSKEYGKVFGIYLGKLPTVVVFDLDILKEVLVKDFGNFTNRRGGDLQGKPVDKGVFFVGGTDWKRIRNIIAPTFSGGKLKQMCGRISDCAVTLSKNFAAAAEKREIVEVKTYFGAYTMDVIAITAFGIVVDSQNDFNNPFVVNAQKFLSGLLPSSIGFKIAFMFPPLAPLVILVKNTFFQDKSVTFFVDTVRQMIEQRKRDTSFEKRNQVDFLQLLVNSELQTEEDGSKNGRQLNLHKKLNIEEIIAQACLFFVAGYETTATTLHYVSYCLATHPDCQEKLMEEINSELGNEEPSYENISKLKYLECVVKETLRMFPPLTQVNRAVAETVTIKGVTFPKGSAVLVPIYHIHHSAENYPDPEEFKPERFASKADMNPLTFLPFGFGPRMCIGMRLALVETKIALVHVLRKVKFVRLMDTPDKIEFVDSGLLRPKTPIRLRVEPRKVAH